jgi:hypothetical protein
MTSTFLAQSGARVAPEKPAPDWPALDFPSGVSRGTLKMSARFQDKFKELIQWELKLEEAQKSYRKTIANEPDPHFLPGGINFYDPAEDPELLLKQISYIRIAIDQLKETITYHELQEAAISWIEENRSDSSIKEVMIEIQKVFELDILDQIPSSVREEATGQQKTFSSKKPRRKQYYRERKMTYKLVEKELEKNPKRSFSWIVKNILGKKIVHPGGKEKPGEPFNYDTYMKWYKEEKASASR